MVSDLLELELWVGVPGQVLEPRLLHLPFATCSLCYMFLTIGCLSSPIYYS